MDRQMVFALASRIAAIHFIGSSLASVVHAMFWPSTFDLRAPSTRVWLLAIPVAGILWIVADAVSEQARRSRPETLFPHAGELYLTSVVLAGAILAALGVALLAWAGCALMVNAQVRHTVLGPIALDAHDRAMVIDVIVKGVAVTGGVQLVVGLLCLVMPDPFVRAAEWARRECAKLGRTRIA